VLRNILVEIGFRSRRRLLNAVSLCEYVIPYVWIVILYCYGAVMLIIVVVDDVVAGRRRRDAPVGSMLSIMDTDTMRDASPRFVRARAPYYKGTQDITQKEVRKREHEKSLHLLGCSISANPRTSTAVRHTATALHARLYHASPFSSPPATTSPSAGKFHRDTPLSSSTKYASPLSS
jgi:hypothetical protein